MHHKTFWTDTEPREFNSEGTTLDSRKKGAILSGYGQPISSPVIPRERVAIMAWGQCGRTVPEIARAFRTSRKALSGESCGAIRPLAVHYVDGAAQMRTIERQATGQSSPPHMLPTNAFGRTSTRNSTLVGHRESLPVESDKHYARHEQSSHEAIYQYIYHAATPDRENSC